MLPLLLLVPLREAPPGKQGGLSEPLLAGTAAAVTLDEEAGTLAAAGVEGGGAAPLAVPPLRTKSLAGSEGQGFSRPSSARRGSVERQHSGSMGRQHSGSIGPGSLRSPRRSLQGRRNSLQYGTSPRLSHWGAASAEGPT